MMVWPHHNYCLLELDKDLSYLQQLVATSLENITEIRESPIVIKVSDVQNS